MRWSPLRLTHKRWKAAYLLAGYAATWIVVALMRRDPGTWVGESVIVIADLVWILFATRIFRVREELLTPPRDWWRMTGRPKAGFILGAFFVAVALAVVPASFVDGRDPTLIVSGIQNAVLGILFLSSSVRLRRLDPRYRPLPRT